MESSDWSIFDITDLLLVRESEVQPQGEYNLAGVNLDTMKDTSALQNVFFNNEFFGVRRRNNQMFREIGCDYCFWTIHFRNRQQILSGNYYAEISTNTGNNHDTDDGNNGNRTRNTTAPATVTATVMVTTAITAALRVPGATAAMYNVNLPQHKTQRTTNKSNTNNNGFRNGIYIYIYIYNQ